MSRPFSLIPMAGGGGGVSNVSSANTDITVATGTTTPVLTLNAGVGANKIVKQDATGKLPALDGSQLTGVQKPLISGTDIKTINSQSILGSGNIVIAGGSGGLTYDITDYGAVGDGTTNALSAIQSAADAAAAVIGDRALVYIPEGRYNLGGGTLTLSGVELGGPGQLYNGQITCGANTRLIGANLYSAYARVAGDDVTIKDCDIGTWTQDWLAGIVCEVSVARCRIVGNRIHHISQLTAYGSSGPTSYGAGIKFYTTSSSTLWQDIIIEGNEIHNINGPGAIWFGVDGRLSRCRIKNNHIHDTACFGIIGYTISYNEALKADDFVIDHNLIENIGSIRDSGAGNGAGGIYMVLGNGHDIHVLHNVIRHVAEVCVEGQIGRICHNVLEDSGAYQLAAPIADCACMYTGLDGAIIDNNTVIRPGGQSNGGGFYLYIAAGLNKLRVTNNTFDNALRPWTASTAYTVGQIVSKGAEWYVCKTAGTSGTTGPSGQTGSITDGSVVWDWKKTIATTGFRLNSASGLFTYITVQHNAFIDFPTCLDIARSSGGCRIDHNSRQNIDAAHVAWLSQWGGTTGTNYQYQPYVDTFG